MDIMVLNNNEQLQTFLSIEGTACPFINPIYTDKINLENTLDFDMPADHEDSQYVKEGALIAFLDLDNHYQVFAVKRITDVDQSGTFKSVYCENIYYELIGDIVPTCESNNTTARMSVQTALQNSRWEVGDVEDFGIKSIAFNYDTALACLQKVAVTYGGELQFRVSFNGSSIAHRYVDLVHQLGANRGKRFELGKDLVKVQRDVDFTNVFTAMYGRGKGESTNAGGYGRRLDFGSIGWQTPTNPANKPLNQKWVGDVNALNQYGLAGGTRHRFGIFQDDQETDPELLLQKTWNALQASNKPRVTYQFDILDMEQISPDYSHEAVRKGDTCVAIDDHFKPAMEVGVRVIGIERHLTEYDKTKVTLGNFIPDIASSQLKQNQINQQVSDKAGVWDNATALSRSALDDTVFELQNTLRALGGYVDMNPTEGVLLYDTPDPAVATNAMKLGGGIFGIANSKLPNGDWDWRTFGTGDGFTADMIVAGILQGGKVNWDLTAGTFIIGNSTTDFKLKFDGTNLIFGDGSITWQNLDPQAQVNLTGPPGVSPYDVVIVSSNGDKFKHSTNFTSTLYAYVYQGGIDITDSIDYSRFRWKRGSTDSGGDIVWNSYHIGYKSIIITQEDVIGSTVFNCEITN